MKVVILAGGLGTRISEETHLKPKPMVEIGNLPIIHHIMKIYSFYGFDEFIICLGYKGYVIKEYFINACIHNSDLTIDMNLNSYQFHSKNVDKWKVSLIDTGQETMTGGRLLRIKNYLDNEPFCLTYGDGLAKIDINKLIKFHKKESRIATLTAVKPPGRFGALEIIGNEVKNFIEKPQGDGGWINGGFFVLEPSIIDYIENEQTIFEKDPLQKLAQERQLASFFHSDFWHPMDTMRDKKYLEELWNSGKAPWKLW